MRENRLQAVLPALESVDPRQWYVAGVGGSAKLGVFFVIIIWAAGQILRKRIGLRSKEFHITLSEADDHRIDKSFDAILPEYIPTPLMSDPDFLDHLAFTFHTEGRFNRARAVGTQLCKTAPKSERGFLRLGDAAFKEEQYKLAMLSYACAFERCSDSKVPDYCLRKTEECAEYTEWGIVFTEADRSQCSEDAPFELFEPWSATLQELSGRELRNPPSRCVPAREPISVPHPIRPASTPEFYRLPRWFRWLVPFHIALMSTPRDASDIEVMNSPNLGIRHVLTLTEETPLDPRWFSRRNIRNTFLPIPNYRPPTLEQMDIIIRMIGDERNTPMLIHCGGGKGRAGTVAACYLVAYGFA